MHVSKMNSPECKLQIGATKIKQVHQFKYLECVLSKDELCNTETCRCIVIGKYNLPKTKQIFSNKIKAFDTKNGVLNSYEILFPYMKVKTKQSLQS